MVPVLALLLEVKQAASLVRHETEVHGPSVWSCKVCAADPKVHNVPVYSSRRNLAEHIYFKHPSAYADMLEVGDLSVKGIKVKAKVKCKVCGFECLKRDMKKHMRRNHGGEVGNEGA
eukprot:CAMPEP_0182472746 /NCGR_PEP_ID=MMETSP1319-20130603/22785_1 /TAXON_ID=172717 /ORGANISM="Bolidomonas pacifica, Strain RCC208" /LENGTH=116 /DNA_ID=CAMNT_0024673481 /DNA_START=145 /DNA_END=492 /DNA_ORIENTATION=-